MLYIAAKGGFIEITKALISAKADVDTVT
ncbi:MAG: hypothetical protein ACR5KV_01080 [Wolbachia sp.]